MAPTWRGLGTTDLGAELGATDLGADLVYTPPSPLSGPLARPLRRHPPAAPPSRPLRRRRRLPSLPSRPLRRRCRVPLPPSRPSAVADTVRAAVSDPVCAPRPTPPTPSPGRGHVRRGGRPGRRCGAGPWRSAAASWGGRSARGGSVAIRRRPRRLARSGPVVHPPGDPQWQCKIFLLNFEF